MQFDLLIKGGEVVDDASGLSGRRDVAVRRDRIAAVDRDIPADSAFRVVFEQDSGSQASPSVVDTQEQHHRGVSHGAFSHEP